MKKKSGVQNVPKFALMVKVEKLENSGWGLCELNLRVKYLSKTDCFYQVNDDEHDISEEMIIGTIDEVFALVF